MYLERTDPVRDSNRFRNRLSAYYWDHLHEKFRDPIRKIIVKETGAEIPYIANFGFSVADFFKKNELRDVLDSITLTYQVVKSRSYYSLAEEWRHFVARALVEENVGYRLDSQCGVHYFVDEEFERNRFSTLITLDDKNYTSVKAAYEDAYRHFDNDPTDTKAAVRSMFESVEILVKQIVTAKNLNKWVVENPLKQKCIDLYKSDKTAEKVVSKLFDGFGRWVDGLHFYRHGQAEDAPVAPSEDIAIYILSSGSAYLRWLVGINNRLGEEGDVV